MKEAVTCTLESHDNTKQRMHTVIIGKINPTSQRHLLQKVIHIIRLAHEQHHVQWIVEPRG